MCGIFGSTNRQQYLTLQQLNLSRGDFAQSSCLVYRDGYEVHKVPLKTKTKYTFPRKKFNWYLGHVQAPTSAKRTFDPQTSHPFMVEDWVVAHNGVLTNFKELVDQFQMPYKNPVDSSIIPYILFSLQSYMSNEVEIITSCLSFLKGTYGVWIYNGRTGNIYLAKCGVTLFADLLENEFSSIKYKFYESLEDGTLYQLTPEGITSISTFECDSPFFTI